MRSVSGDIRFVRSYPLASFGHAQNFERTPPGKYVRWMNVTHALVCGLSGSRAVCPVLMCVRRPVDILCISVDVRSTRIVNGQLQNRYM